MLFHFSILIVTILFVLNMLPFRKSEGKGLDGAQAEYVRVPLASGSLLKLPDSIDDEEAILLGDILSTGFFCASNGFSALTEMEPSEAVVVVIGCGPVGMLACIGAKEYGAKQVFVVDSVSERLQVAAERFGATPLNLKDDVVATVKSATDGRGADIVLEVR
jgi:threonine dehydrogenase-like Zn-dependent dehydrogenase